MQQRRELRLVVVNPNRRSMLKCEPGSWPIARRSSRSSSSGSTQMPTTRAPSPMLCKLLRCLQVLELRDPFMLAAVHRFVERQVVEADREVAPTLPFNDPPMPWKVR